MFSSELSDLKLDDKGSIGYTYKTMGAGFWALKQDDFRTAMQELLMEVTNWGVQAGFLKNLKSSSNLMHEKKKNGCQGD